MAANATFALKPGVWFLRVRFVIFAPDSRREPSPPSGRKSTQPTVQILEASSVKENEEARRLTTIPGVGPIVASALVAAVGRAESFDRGRDLAAWLGLVPR